MATAKTTNAIAHTAMNVWLVAPSPATKSVSDEEAPPAVLVRGVPAHRQERRPRHEERVQRVHPLDVGLRPERGAEGEEERGEDGGGRGEARLPGEAIQHAARGGPAEGGEQAHAKRDRADGDQQGPQLAEQHVQRVARGVGDAEDRDRGDQLAAVPDVDGAAGAQGVDHEHARGDDEGDREVRRARGQGVFGRWRFLRFSRKSTLSGSISRPRFKAATAAGVSPFR